MAHVTRLRATALIAAFVLGLAFPGLAFAQASLPWQPSPAPGQQQTQPTGQPHQHYHHNAQSGNASARPSGARAQDDRRLDSLASKYYDVSSKDPNAISKLKRLQREVNEFRTGLAQANYDAGDIIKDAKKLERRISAKRKKLEQAQIATDPTPMPAPPAPPPAPPCCKSPAVAAPPPSSYIPPLPQTQPMIPAPAPPTR